MRCLDCSFENIRGAETCERCGQTLIDHDDDAGGVLAFRLLETEVGVLIGPAALFIDAGATIGEALAMLCEKSIGCVLVKDAGGKMVGIFSERDALLKIDPRKPGVYDRPVSELMTPEPESIDAKEKVAFAIRAMDLGGYRHLPVTSDGDVVGVVTARDVLRFLTAAISPAHVA